MMTKKDETVQKPAQKPAEKNAASTGPEVPTQREAVYQCIVRVLKSKSVEIKKGQIVQDLLTQEMRDVIYKSLAQEFVAKKIALKITESNQRKMSDPNVLRVYIIGLVNNWLRRDVRLNGK